MGRSVGWLEAVGGRRERRTEAVGWEVTVHSGNKWGRTEAVTELGSERRKGVWRRRGWERRRALAKVPNRQLREIQAVSMVCRMVSVEEVEVGSGVDAEAGVWERRVGMDSREGPDGDGRVGAMSVWVSGHLVMY